MLEGGGGGLGEVAVDVYADLTRLESDFNKAKTATQKFSNDLEQKVGGAAKASAKDMQQLEREVLGLARAYSPVHAAAVRMEQDLDKIARAQAAGVLSAQEAAFFTGKATAAYNESTKAQSNMTEWAGKARAQLLLLGAAMATAVVSGAIAMGKAAIENAKAIKDTSAELGLSVEAWQEWQYIAQQSGVEIGQLEQGFESLQRTMGKAAAGSKREADLFKLLRVNLRDASGEAKSVDLVMAELADALLLVEDANQRAALAQILFGESANEMMPALAGGSAGINALADAAHELGLVLSDQEIQKLDDAGKKFDALKQILSAKIAHLVAENADSIMEFTDNLLEFGVAAIGAFNAMAKFASSPFGQAVSGLTSMINPLTGVIRLLTIFNRLQGGGGGGDTSKLPSQNSLAERFRALAGGGGASGAPIDASAFLARPGRTPRARAGGRDTSEQDRLRKLRADVAFENELAQLAAQILNSASKRATNADQRAEIELRLLDIEKQRFQRTLALEGPAGSKKYDQAEVVRLQAAFDAADADKRMMVGLEQEEKNASARLSLSSSRLDNEAELFSIERGLARSSKERRETDLALLDLEHDLERSKIEAVLASKTATDVEKQIAEERLRHLAELKELQIEVINRETQGPVADFFDSLQMTADEMEDAIDRIRATKLEEQRERAVRFADDIGAAFGDMARSIMNLESPLEILKNLLMDLASTFTEEVLIRPFEEMARNKIGGPLAERVVGAPAGAEGLWLKNLETASLGAKLQLDQLALAATRAAQGFSVSMIEGVDPLGAASADAATDLASAASGADAFANTATNAAQQLLGMLAGGGGGGGTMGWIKMGLSLAASAAGSSIGGGGAPAWGGGGGMPVSGWGTPGLYHEGGIIGPGGRPRRGARLKPGEVDIRARIGETVIPEGPSRQFAPLLESIRSGRLPQMGRFGGMGQKVDQRSYPTTVGDIHVHGVTDERIARRSGKQVAAQIQRDISRGAKQGIRRD